MGSDRQAGTGTVTLPTGGQDILCCGVCMGWIGGLSAGGLEDGGCGGTSAGRLVLLPAHVETGLGWKEVLCERDK